MKRIPEIARDEANRFKEQALAIISGKYDNIIESGFLDRNNFYDENGIKNEYFDDEVSQELANKLLKSSSQVLTAYEVDLHNNEVGKMYSIAEKENYHKSYVRVSIYDGEHINGELTFSNKGDVYIHTFDKENNLLHSNFDYEIDTDHELFLLADHISGESFSNRLLDLDEDITYEESAYYLNHLEINQFRSQEEYNNTKSYYMRNILLTDDEYEIKRALSFVMEGEGNINYIILTQEENDKVGIIAERDGNILYSNYESGEFETYDQGEKFNILGAEEIADKHILRSVMMYLDGMHEMTTSFEELSEPEVKKTKTFKPGR